MGNFFGCWRIDCFLQIPENCDCRIDYRNHLFPSHRESNHPCYHETGLLYFHCRRDGEKSGGHVSAHRVSRSGENDPFCRCEPDCSLLSDVGCLSCQSVGGANPSSKIVGVKPFSKVPRKTEISRCSCHLPIDLLCTLTEGNLPLVLQAYRFLVSSLSKSVIRCESPERARDYPDAQHLSLRLTQSTAQCQCMRLNVYFARPWGVRLVGMKAQHLNVSPTSKVARECR